MATAVVIEDNPVNMELAALLLHKAGHLVMCAADVEAGVAQACADFPDPVLMGAPAL